MTLFYQSGRDNANNNSQKQGFAAENFLSAQLAQVYASLQHGAVASDDLDGGDSDQFLPLADDESEAEEISQGQDHADALAHCDTLQKIAPPREGKTWRNLFKQAQEHWQGVPRLTSALEAFSRFNLRKPELTTEELFLDRGTPAQRAEALRKLEGNAARLDAAKSAKALLEIAQGLHPLALRSWAEAPAAESAPQAVLRQKESRAAVKRAQMSQKEICDLASERAAWVRMVVEEMGKTINSFRAHGRGAEVPDIVHATADAVRAKILALDPRYKGLSAYKDDERLFRKWSKPSLWRKRMTASLADDRASWLRGYCSYDYGNMQLHMSREAALARADQAQASRNFMENTWLAAEMGDQNQGFTVAEAWEKGPSNPVVAAAEHGVRAVALTKIYTDQGLEPRLFTGTLPSRFHPRALAGKILDANGKTTRHRTVPNQRYNHLLCPRDGKNWLMSAWRQVGRFADREGISFEFIRCLEVHKTDGTPHLHATIFARPDQWDRLEEILREQFLWADSPEEPGAVERRVTIKKIQGSAEGNQRATNYILKSIFYILKQVGAGQGDNAAPGQKFLAHGGEIDQLRSIGAHSIEYSQDFVGMWRFLRSVANPRRIPMCLLKAWGYAHAHAAAGQNPPWTRQKLDATAEMSDEDLQRKVRSLDAACRTAPEHYAAFFAEMQKLGGAARLAGEIVFDQEEGEYRERKNRHLRILDGAKNADDLPMPPSMAMSWQARRDWLTRVPAYAEILKTAEVVDDPPSDPRDDWKLDDDGVPYIEEPSWDADGNFCGTQVSACVTFALNEVKTKLWAPSKERSAYLREAAAVSAKACEEMRRAIALVKQAGKPLDALKTLAEKTLKTAKKSLDAAAKKLELDEFCGQFFIHDQGQREALANTLRSLCEAALTSPPDGNLAPG